MSLIMMAMMMMIPLMLVQMTVMLFPANKEKKNTVVDETCAAGFGVSLCFVTNNDSKL